MNKEIFGRNIEGWADYYQTRGLQIKGSRENEENLPERLRRLYSIAHKEFAPILSTVKEIVAPSLSVDSVVFDFPALSIKEHTQLADEVNKQKELGSPELYYVDLNLLNEAQEPIVGFRLFDKGDNVVWVKVINCRNFYLLDNGNIFYGVKNIMDKNDMNILRSRVADYFLDKEHSQIRLP